MSQGSGSEKKALGTTIQDLLEHQQSELSEAAQAAQAELLIIQILQQIEKRQRQNVLEGANKKIQTQEKQDKPEFGRDDVDIEKMRNEHDAMLNGGRNDG